MTYQVQYVSVRGWKAIAGEEHPTESAALNAAHQWSKAFEALNGRWPTTRVVPVEDQPKTNQ